MGAEAFRPLPEARAAGVAAAVRAAFLDLLRPVQVRDTRFNALGRVGDDHPLSGWDGAAERPAYEVQAHPAATAGYPPGLVGGRDWHDLLVLVRHMGHGDIAAGKGKAVAMLREAVLLEVRGAPLEVRLLVASRRRERADEFPPWDFGLDHEQVVHAAALGRALDDPMPADLSPDLRGFTAEQASEADRYAVALGLGGGAAMGLARQVRQGRLEEEWDRLWDAAGDDLPDETVILRRFDLVTDEDLDGFAERMRGLGRPAVADWAEALLRRDGGRSDLGRILYRLVMTRRVHEEEKGASPAP